MMKQLKQWDPLESMLNWSGIAAVLVAFLTVCLMNTWQGV